MLTLLSSVTEMNVGKLEYFFLVLVRISFVIFLLPYFQSKEVPIPVKSGLCLAFAIVVWPFLPTQELAIHQSLPHFFLLVLEQCLVGIMIAFTANFVLYFMHIGGSLMARDMGLTRAEGMEPILDESADDIATLMLLVFSIIFLIRGYHHFFLQVMMDSFQSIPVGLMEWRPAYFASFFTYLLSSSIVTGLRLAAPVMATVFLAVVGLALVSRIMPQMNVWIVGIPVKIGLGVLTIVYAFPAISILFDANFSQVQEAMLLLLKQQAPHG